jgi:hypothetical protein
MEWIDKLTEDQIAEVRRLSETMNLPPFICIVYPKERVSESFARDFSSFEPAARRQPGLKNVEESLQT